MPNRILKESICTNEQIDRLSPFDETVFYRLIVTVDDYGRFDARPSVLRSRLFPLKNVRAEQIEKSLCNLSSAELVSLYIVSGKPFLRLTGWERNQQIRAQKSKFPGPDDVGVDLIASDINCNQMISDAPVIVIENVIENENISEMGSMSPAGDAHKPKKTVKSAEISENFKQFWAVYPKKQAKQAAIKAWNKINPDEALTQTIIAAVEQFKTTNDWQKERGQFIPLPATFLNGQRWEDEINVAIQENKAPKAHERRSASDVGWVL